MVLGGILFGSIFILMILGLIVEKTNFLGNVYNGDVNEEINDRDLVKGKSAVGKFFLCFSPSRNIYKIFYSPPPKDTDLEVLNGVRVLSMLWVILGHAYFTVLLFPVKDFTFIEKKF